MYVHMALAGKHTTVASIVGKGFGMCLENGVNSFLSTCVRAHPLSITRALMYAHTYVRTYVCTYILLSMFLCM